MQITERLLKPLPEVQYLNTENTDRYRCIMRIFYENTEKLHSWMYQEEVFESLRNFPEFREYRLEQCQQDLNMLVNWHNLETLQDTRHVSSLEEFQSKRYRYQMSPYSVEIERLVLRLENLQIEGGSLEPTLLERIRRSLERFPEMADATPAEAYDFWDELERNFTRLNQNYHDYIRDLSSVRAEEMMHTQEFLLFKDKLVEYLRNFVTTLQRNVGVIEELLENLSPTLCDTVLERVNAYEASIPRMEAVDPAAIAENNRGKLESIRRWFQTAEGEDNEAGKLFDATNDIIRRITRFAMELSEKSAMGANRREEYRKAAELFLACTELSEAHRLSACIFGVETPRHLQSEREPESMSMNLSAYALEPEQKQLKSRSRKGTERSNRSAIADHTAEKKAVREKLLAEQQKQQKALQRLEKDGCIEFAKLPRLTPDLREILLRWLSDALEDPGRSSRTETGRVFQLEAAEDGGRCLVRCTDGNANPERLDPFGSRDRKMAGYLLEEGDGRDERTGYLYMEFKRENSEAYLTIGMGIRARRGKPLDKWYFGILDGRRVGKDFSLYKNSGEKLTLSRKELENRLAEGGRVYERQAEYIEFVNQQLFGFATTDAYREMLDLLIQLRTPKLSRDFKPSVINDILSSALQGLSEEDLRPMTEAIENMDSLRLQLETKEAARKAAERIANVFGRYNQCMLYEKAAAAEQAEKRLKENEKQQTAEQTRRTEAAQRLAELTEELAKLSSQKAAMEQEREELGKSDAYQLKQEEQRLTERIRELTAQLSAKEAQIEKKQENVRTCAAQLQRSTEKQAEKRQEIEECLESMAEEADTMSYQAQSFLADELRKALAEALLQALCHFADAYDGEADYQQAKQPVDVLLQDLRLQLKQEIEDRRIENRKLSEERNDCLEELHQWENAREPEPERSPAVLENRRRLTKRGIPYHEFYKTLEFAASLDEESRNRIEEAMLEMGLLDALVIEESYRQEVLRMDPGACDRYIFVRENAGRAGGKTALETLELNDSVNTVFLNMEMTEILRHISIEGSGETVISADGTWRNGLLAGTISGEYQAGFIGTKARERNRAEKIRVLQERIAALEQQMAVLAEEMENFRGRMTILETEYAAFPKEKPLREAQRACEEAEKLLSVQNTLKKQLDEAVHALIQSLQEDRTQAAKLAEKLYLHNSLECFEAAAAAAADYQNDLHTLKLTHASYLDTVAVLEQQTAQKEMLEEDLDQLRYDQGRVEQEKRRAEDRRESIEKQLALTDYAAIRDRLEHCIQWLSDYDRQRGSCEKERGNKEAECRSAEEKLTALSEASVLLTEEQKFATEVYLAEYQLGYVFSDAKADSDSDQEVQNRSPQETVLALKKRGEESLEQLQTRVQQVYFENSSYLIDYQLSALEQFGELGKQKPTGSSWSFPVQRLDYQARYHGEKIPFQRLSGILDEELEELRQLIRQNDRELFEDILSNTMSRKIRSRINSAQSWVENMNRQMESMNTSSGLKLRLRWRSKTAESESQLDTAELVELLRKDYRSMREEEANRLSQHFRSKVEESRRIAEDSGGAASFYQVMQDALDYRKWFEFQLFCEKPGERQKELTNSVFGTFSGGEKAMSMYVPLFSAVTAKYHGARPDAPQIVSLDEAFAGVDSRNIRDMFRLMREFGFDFIINSQVLWGDADTLDALSIYELLRPNNAKFVTVLSFLWNGKNRSLLPDEKAMEEESRKLDAG